MARHVGMFAGAPEPLIEAVARCKVSASTPFGGSSFRGRTAGRNLPEMPAMQLHESPRLSIALLVVLALPVAGCAATASFHSKNGQDYPALTERAVQCNDAEVPAVIAAGGYPIGTIEGKGLVVDATDADVADKAAIVAAKRGGTHVLRTEAGIESYAMTTPAERSKTCTRTDDTVDCKTTYTPASMHTIEHPTGNFVVFRVAPERWGALPEPIRPARAD